MLCYISITYNICINASYYVVSQIYLYILYTYEIYKCVQEPSARCNNALRTHCAYSFFFFSFIDCYYLYYFIRDTP